MCFELLLWRYLSFDRTGPTICHMRKRPSTTSIANRALSHPFSPSAFLMLRVCAACSSRSQAVCLSQRLVTQGSPRESDCFNFDQYDHCSASSLIGNRKSRSCRHMAKELLDKGSRCSGDLKISSQPWTLPFGVTHRQALPSFSCCLNPVCIGVKSQRSRVESLRLESLAMAPSDTLPLPGSDGTQQHSRREDVLGTQSKCFRRL